MSKTRMSPAPAFPARRTDAEGAVLEPLVPPLKGGGRPPKYTRRAILDAIRYAVRQGCTWRALPADPPPMDTGLWEYPEWQKGGAPGPVQGGLPGGGAGGRGPGGEWV